MIPVLYQAHAFSFDLDPFMPFIPRKLPFSSSAVNLAIRKLRLQLLSVSNKRGRLKFPVENRNRSLDRSGGVLYHFLTKFLSE
ncbi:hypothetical protein QKW34_20245 [Bacillus licheniformis]|nr:hypothetical protein QKW34_20245 [Bacillus licheniformis]